ncbi:MAG TPA: CDP-diacylglycerol--glycerol-3-phosphate 3-phosphatidyltransferase [Verrucomicrobiales bacterium]|nr:CDP-diacylglycerol--glycerol-3-phosphate 3-phosphatidyltransferase [Verrucomicrobiales bacterium]
MNLPNQLTVARLFMTLVFVAVLAFSFPWSSQVALGLFIVASLTDWLDGLIARRWGLITNFGKLMDPLVDKILTCSALIMLAAGANPLFPPWAVVVVLAREFLVTGLRLIAGSQGDVLVADSLGKWKTVTQIAAIIYFLAWLASSEEPLGAVFSATLFAPSWMQPAIAGKVLIAATLLTTVVSGCSYLWKNRRLLLSGV